MPAFNVRLQCHAVEGFNMRPAAGHEQPILESVTGRRLKNNRSVKG